LQREQASLNDYRIQLAIYHSLNPGGRQDGALDDGAFFAHSNMHMDPRLSTYEAIRLNQVATHHNSMNNLESNHEIGGSQNQLNAPNRPAQRVRNQVEIYNRNDQPPALDEGQNDSQNDNRQRFLPLGNELWLEIK
jgi:hypothetical protein